MNAFAAVSDSGTLPEESSFFTSDGKLLPAVCIRISTEQSEALGKACFVLAWIDEKSLLQAVDTAVEMNLGDGYGIPVPDYVEENLETLNTRNVGFFLKNIDFTQAFLYYFYNSVVWFQRWHIIRKGDRRMISYGDLIYQFTDIYLKTAMECSFCKESYEMLDDR